MAVLACLAFGCGSRLGTAPPPGSRGPSAMGGADGGQAGAGADAATPPTGGAGGAGSSPSPVGVDAGAAGRAMPGTTVAGRDAGATAVAATDAGGPPLAPYPPATCQDASWAPAVPRPATVSACGGQLALSPSLTLSSPATEHFFRCATIGPEIETDVRFSPDGARLATLTGAGTLRLFATDDWHEIAQLAPPTGRFDAFAFSPDGAHFATLATERGELVIWNAADATPLATSFGKGTAGGIPIMQGAVAFSRDGSRIASSLGSIVDLQGRTVVPLSIGGGGFVDQLAFTMCDAMVYVRSGFQTGDSNWTTVVQLDDAHTGQSHVLFEQWGVVFGGSALSQDGRLLAMAALHGNDTNDLSIYRGDTGQLVDYRATWRPGVIQAVTPDDTAVLVAQNNELDEWRLADGATVNTFWFGTGARLLGFPRSDAITISDPTDTTSLSLSTPYKVIATQQQLSATAVSWTGDGAAAAAVAGDGLLFHVWREPDATPLCSPSAPGPVAAATSFAMSGDGSTIAIGKADGVIDLFDSASGARRAGIETPQGPVGAVQLSWDGRRAAAQAGLDGPVQIWSADGSLVGAVPMPAHPTSGYAQGFALLPGGETVAFSETTYAPTATTTALTLADVATGAARPFSAATPWVRGSAFSPDSLHLAAWANDALGTWRVADGVEDDVLVAPADVAPMGYLTVPSIALASDWSSAAALNGTSLVVFDPHDGTELSNSRFPADYEDTVLGIAGTTVAVSTYLIHTFAADYYLTHFLDASTGAELRAFTTAGPRPLLLSARGDRAYTLEAPDVIAWCR